MMLDKPSGSYFLVICMHVKGDRFIVFDFQEGSDAQKYSQVCMSLPARAFDHPGYSVNLRLSTTDIQD